MQFQSKAIFICFLVMACNETPTQSTTTPTSPDPAFEKKAALPTEEKEQDIPPSHTDIDKDKPTGDEQIETEETDAEISPLLGQWELRNSEGIVMMTVWITETQVSRQSAVTPRLDFPLVTMEQRNGLYYTVHEEPLFNQTVDRHCLHKIVKEASQTYYLVGCATDMMPTPDWNLFTKEHRYIKTGSASTE